MKRVFVLLLFAVMFSAVGLAQTPVRYEISFDNALHHEANVIVHFDDLENKVLEVRMSRTSPGRYALHEFAKNVYGVKAYDSKGQLLQITRPNPHQWNISGHDGSVRFEYTLYANRGDGTYSQVDETHAHLNIPATFAWARHYGHRPVEVTFDLREDLGWKVATQLKHLKGNTYTAPDWYYFMDSPVEIADLHIREEMMDGQNIRLALHTPATKREVDDYFEKVMAIVAEQKKVFGELPEFDFGEYTFLSCYMPNASGDGMEHRNSTIVTNSKSLDRPLGETSIGTISHEFFHAWNVERIRPASLEPFDFEEANMSGELWFAEGFTSYYTGLILARAGIRIPEQYVEGLDGGLNRVINSSGREFYSPVEMSYQAPFVDAARSVDPVNRDNTFISYYTYGSVLGLALDLSLRSMDNGKNLDDFMKLVWQKYGITEIPYTIRDLETVLGEYVNEYFAEQFFDNFIFDSKLPDYEKLLANVGVTMELMSPGEAALGTEIRIEDGVGKLRSNAIKGSPVYEAGIETEDEILSIAGMDLSSVNDIDELLGKYVPGDSITITFRRWGKNLEAKVILTENNRIRTHLNTAATEVESDRRRRWLN
ncbi:M61 family metallopeptidase [Balneola sp. MJW-20]|uniref:M61 family metallopeptidase n=1 Tax=Gracilimonas aurantiaca TaxID=3234185 RepID=UPI00346721AE